MRILYLALVPALLTCLPSIASPLDVRIGANYWDQSWQFYAGLGAELGYRYMDLDYKVGDGLLEADPRKSHKGKLPYIAGARLTVFDFSVASLLSGLYDQQPASWINGIADEFLDLRDYAERIQNETGVYARK